MAIEKIGYNFAERAARQGKHFLKRGVRWAGFPFGGKV